MAKAKTPAKRIRALLKRWETEARTNCANPAASAGAGSAGMDQIRAVRYVRSVVDAQKHIGATRDEFLRIADQLEASLPDFARTHPDPERQGYQSLVAIIAAIRAMAYPGASAPDETSS